MLQLASLISFSLFLASGRRDYLNPVATGNRQWCPLPVITYFSPFGRPGVPVCGAGPMDRAVAGFSEQEILGLQDLLHKVLDNVVESPYR